MESYIRFSVSSVPLCFMFVVSSEWGANALHRELRVHPN
jgi:hypothetical protein